MKETIEGRLLAEVERWNILLGLVLVVAAAFLHPTARVVGGVAAGAALGWANFHVLRRLVERITVARSKGLLLFILSIKMVLLLAIVWAVLKLLPVDVIAFTIGLSLFLVSILIATVKIMVAQGEADAPADKPNGASDSEERLN